jgi:hypothetical protein
VALPRVDPSECAMYLSEEKAGDYPEGKYERDLQIAAETGDQYTLDGLFARHSFREVRRIGLVLLGAVLALAIVIAFLKEPKDKGGQNQKKTDTQESVQFKLPEPSRFAPLDEQETAALRERLLALAKERDILTPSPAAGALLVVGSVNPLTTAELLVLERQHWLSAEALLLDAIDCHLGTPDPERRGGPLRNLGPIERQLRGLVFKHGIERYNDLRLTPGELVEKLQEKLNAEKKP